MIITDNNGRKLTLTTKGLFEPKSTSQRFMLELSEFKRALKSDSGVVYIKSEQMNLFVLFRPPIKKTARYFCLPHLYETGRIGCSTFSLAEWNRIKAMALHGKTTKKPRARAAKAGA